MSGYRNIQTRFANNLGTEHKELYEWVNGRPEQEQKREILLRQALLGMSDKMLPSHLYETTTAENKGYTTGYIAVKAAAAGVPIEHIKSIVAVMS